MDDQRGHGAAARGLFKFVGPAAVVGEGFPLEEIGIVGDGFVHKKESDFAFEIDSFVIVPLIFRGFNAVPQKNDGRVDVGDFFLCFVAGDKIIEELQRERVTLVWNHLEGGVRKGFHGDHGNVLEKSVIVASGLEAIRGELLGDVVGRFIATGLAHAAPFQGIARKILHVLADFFGAGGRQFYCCADSRGRLCLLCDESDSEWCCHKE